MEETKGTLRRLNILSAASLESHRQTPAKVPSADTRLPVGINYSSMLPQLLAAVTVSLCSMLVGFCQAYTSPALASMNLPNSTLTVTAQQESWIGSLLPLSALFGGILGGPIIEKFGRKITILLTAPPFILSFLLISFARGVAMVMVGRSISGFCVGMASLTLPVYLGETLEPSTRGSLGLLPTALGNGGILICYITGKFLDWSKLALLGACLPLPYLLLMFLIPETPRWYINNNDPKSANKALQWLRGKDADVGKELGEIESAHQTMKEEDNSATLRDYFKRRYMLPLAISVGLMFFQQLSGINAVIFYTVKIFQGAGSTIDSNLSAIIVGIVNFGSTFVATLIIDKLGRKILLYISSVSMIVTLNVLGAFFYLKDVRDADLSAYGWLPLTSFVVFVIGFSIGFGPIPWLMMGEILPAKIRGNAASIVTAFNWACTFLVTKTFADVTEHLGSHGAFWTFGGFCVLGLGFVVFLVPETQCKSLEDIEKHFSGKKSLHTPGEPVPAIA